MVDTYILSRLISQKHSAMMTFYAIQIHLFLKCLTGDGMSIRPYAAEWRIVQQFPQKRSRLERSVSGRTGISRAYISRNAHLNPLVHYFYIVEK